jgi:hypothetical protein
MSHDLEAQELSHIKAMIRELERLAQGNPVVPASAVTTPAYWRTRINAVLATPHLPRSIAEQASELLSRLDSLPAASGTTVSGIRRKHQPDSPVRDSGSSGCRRS